MYFVLVRAAFFILTALIMSSLAMGRLTGNNVDGNDINDIFQPLPEVNLFFFYYISLVTTTCKMMNRLNML